MTRAPLLLAGLLALAACSGSDASSDAVETAPPTTTAATAPPTDPTTTLTTTTTSTTTTTTPTTTVLDIETPATDRPASDPASIDAAFAVSFEGYRAAWALRRAAVRSPSDLVLRSELANGYVDNENLASIVEFLDSLLTSAERSVENPERPSTVEFVQGVAVTENGQVTQFVICEVLNDDVVDTASAEVVFSGSYAYQVQVFMELDDEIWKIANESVDVEYPGAETCDG